MTLKWDIKRKHEHDTFKGYLKMKARKGDTKRRHLKETVKRRHEKETIKGDIKTKTRNMRQ